MLQLNRRRTTEYVDHDRHPTIRIVDRFDGDIARFKRLKGIETTANNVSGSNST